MKNTRIIYDSTEQTPAVLPAFAELLPPLSDEQYAALETDILQNGCYSPIIVNEELTVIDGHHRHAICEKHGLPYQMAVFAFEDDLEAQRWALDTQKARRNLSVWELGQIALKLKPEIEARAADNKGVRTDLRLNSDEGFKPTDTKQELADAAGLSRDTISKVIQIDERAPETVKAAMDNGLSVNAGYNIMRLLEKLPEEARDAAAERAVALAKQRKDYKAAFDISLADMNDLIQEDDGAAESIRAALEDGSLSVAGGKETGKALLELPEDVRETASASAGELAEIEEDYRKETESVDENARIAKAYNEAFECAGSVRANEHEVRMWIEWAGVRKDEIAGLIAEAEDAAQAFSRIAETLRKIHEQEVAPYEGVKSESRTG